MVEGQRAVPDMPRESAQFEPVAWWWARREIGRDLRERYEVSKYLPPKLLALVRKLDAVEGKYLSRDAPPAEPRVDHPSDDWSLCT